LVAKGNGLTLPFYILMNKIKVLHIIKSLGRGGAEMLLPETLKLHDRGKFEFHYIYFLPWKDQMVEEIKKAGGKVICFEAENNIRLLSKYNKVAFYCGENQIDIIHAHLPWSGFLSRLIHRKTGIPVIYTEHNIQERYHFATKLLNKLSFNFQSLALGVSEDVTRSIMENIKPRIPVQTLLNGVNTENFRKNDEKGKDVREKYGIPKSDLVIGNIAVFREQKCIPVWLKAFHEISKKHPEVYGILVGAGSKEEEIKALIEELGLTERVMLTGLQTDTVSYFSAMDIFMMSSAFEGLPIALLEAMSMNCAVVSTKAGGVIEVIKELENGLLCEVGDIKCLAEKATRLIENKTLREKLQVEARSRVETKFSLEAMVQKLEEIYLNITRV